MRGRLRRGHRRLRRRGCRCRGPQWPRRPRRTHATAGDDGTIDATFPPYDASGTGLIDAACSTPSLALARAPVILLFGIDGSSSLSDSTLSRVASALDRTIDAMAKAHDASLQVGLYVLGDSNDESCLIGGACDGPYPGLSGVAIARVDSAQHDAPRARIVVNGR